MKENDAGGTKKNDADLCLETYDRTIDCALLSCCDLEFFCCYQGDFCVVINALCKEFCGEKKVFFECLSALCFFVLGMISSANVFLESDW